MADVIQEFLDRLGRNEVSTTEFLPPAVHGTVRLDIECDSRTEQWFVTMQKGKVLVARAGREPEAVMRGSRPAFDRLASGAETFVSLLFRNDVVVEGNIQLVDRFSRLFPSPSSAQHPREFARRERQRRER
ncbi:SCP2 sterol-binding domain-containing protein [Micromonospora sp. NPDC048930]|uniref:SCP2 sterol-binding domain-containing protein n=1 Tax=Micromonospora sp. NPDC048930 TaxID=3364261 RepID=UPI0037102EC5